MIIYVTVYVRDDTPNDASDVNMNVHLSIQGTEAQARGYITGAQNIAGSMIEEAITAHLKKQMAINLAKMSSEDW